MGDVLIPEIPQGGQNRVGRGLPQSTQGGGLDVVGKLLQAVYIFKLAVAGNNLVQDLEEALGADAARRTFAARFVDDKLHVEARDVDHAVVLIQNDHSAGPHH